MVLQLSAAKEDILRITLEHQVSSSSLLVSTTELSCTDPCPRSTGSPCPAATTMPHSLATPPPFPTSTSPCVPRGRRRVSFEEGNNQSYPPPFHGQDDDTRIHNTWYTLEEYQQMRCDMKRTIQQLQRTTRTMTSPKQQPQPSSYHHKHEEEKQAEHDRRRHQCLQVSLPEILAVIFDMIVMSTDYGTTFDHEEEDYEDEDEQDQEDLSYCLLSHEIDKVFRLLYNNSNNTSPDNNDDDDDDDTLFLYELIGLERQVQPGLRHEVKDRRDHLHHVVWEIQHDCQTGYLSPDKGSSELQRSCRLWSRALTLFATSQAKAVAAASTTTPTTTTMR